MKSQTNEDFVCRRPTLKDVQRNGSVRKPLYERSLYERTFMSEPIENHVISNEPSYHNLDKKHLQKRHRICRNVVNQVESQYELYNVSATRAERLENLFTNVCVRVHPGLQKCIVILRLGNLSLSLNPLRHFVKVY